MPIRGPEMEQTLADLGATHVVWLPDSAMGPWEESLEGSDRLSLVRVCREGEAWAVAAGLWLGGKAPVVMIQNTGLFESGDALRNVLFDMRLPLWAVVGYRSYLNERSTDTARHFTEPILRAWGLEHVLLEGDAPLEKLRRHFLSCREANRPAVALVPEGRL